MRTVTFGCANSLDNFIARSDGGVDWLRWSGEAKAIMAAYWPTVDAVVMGRKTWEAAGKGGGHLGGVASYVCSRTLPPGRRGHAEVVADAVACVRGLKQQQGRGICVLGGGDLARSLFEADLIDEVGCNIHPVLLGAGVPMYHPLSRQVDLQFVECKVQTTGCVYLLYRVAR
jgi:dihydrofolate reductase